MLTFAERLAAQAARENQRPVVPRLDAELARRPSVARLFGGGRGAIGWAFIHGRMLHVHHVEVPGDAVVGIDEVADRGVPEPYATKLGDDAVRPIVDAAKALRDLPCMCGTGVETLDQHGTIETLASAADYDAPVDCRVTVGRCSVCGRGWTFEEAGDSMYSYHYEVRRFPEVDG